ncbi:hypothetical protein BgiBS90_009081, partial [Biomphalaria glabrata]
RMYKVYSTIVFKENDSENKSSLSQAMCALYREYQILNPPSDTISDLITGGSVKRRK